MSIEPLDPTIIAGKFDLSVFYPLPAGCEIISVVRHGNTNWSTGLRINVHVGDEERQYFLKVLDGENAVKMAEGEYESQKALEAYIPDNVVHPVAWGKFQENENKAWFLADFLNLQACSPPLAEFLAILEKLHQSWVSPNGKFGFHVTTFYGAPPMKTEWTDTWEEFFTREFRSNLDYAQQNRGRLPGLDEVSEEFIGKVIPRLLRPLETGGRKIKPTLCHGDLWDGNIQIDLDRRQPVIFDACAFYGHHEMDFQCMRDPRYAIGPEFVDLYRKKLGASEPMGDFDDRNALYSMRNDILTAGMWPQWASLLQRVKDEMLRLLAKHPDGLGGFRDPHSQDEKRTTCVAGTGYRTENEGDGCLDGIVHHL